MKFYCETHGEIDKLYVYGYNIADETRLGAGKRDLEGITFVVHAPDESELSPDDIKPDGPYTDSYLEKFGDDFDERLAEVVDDYLDLEYELSEKADVFCPFEAATGEEIPASEASSGLDLQKTHFCEDVTVTRDNE